MARVFAAARFDVTRALALATSADPAAALIGIVTTFIPGQLPVVALLLISWSRAYYARGRRAAVLDIISIATAATVLFLTPWTIALIFAVAYAAAWLLVPRVLRRTNWKAPPRGPNTLAPVETALVVLASGLLLFLTTSVMWLPAERLQLPGGQLVGYVVRQDGAWTAVLRESDRTIVFVPTTSIGDRSLCQIGSVPAPSLVNIGRPLLPLPSCPP